MASEEKLIVDLVTRVSNELPIPISQRAGPPDPPDLLKQTEESLVQLSPFQLNQIAQALLQNLKTLIATQTPTEEMVMKQGQSILSILSLFHKCSSFRWNHIKKQFQPTSDSNEEKIRIKNIQEQITPPALDEGLALELYKIFVSLVNKNSNLPLDLEIQAKAGQCLFQLSATNYDCIINNVTQCLSGNFSEEDTISQLGLIERLNIDAKHLSALFDKIHRSVPSIKKSSIQVALSKALYRAIWNWIDNYPMEFVNLCHKGEKLAGNPDLLFDVFDQWTKKHNFWPIQTMLLILCPDLMIQIHEESVHKELKNKEQFLENLKKSLKSGKQVDVSTVCCVDIYKASTFVAKTERSALRQLLVPAIEYELTRRVFPEKEKEKTENVDESIMVDFLLSAFLISAQKIIKSHFSLCIKGPIQYKRVLVRTITRLAKEATLPWNPTIADCYSALSSNLRQMFLEYINSAKDYASWAKAERKPKGYEKTVQEAEVLQQLITLFHIDPALCLFLSPKAAGEADLSEEVKNVINGLAVCTTLVALPSIAEEASKALLTLHEPKNIPLWNPSDPLLGLFTASSSVNTTIANVLIEQKETSQQDIQEFVYILEKLLRYRNEYLASTPIKLDQSTKSVRYLSSLILEVAFLIHLCNGSPEICSSCARCFGLLCTEVTILNVNDESDNIIVANFSAYKQLAAAGVLSTGRQAQQKNIRSMLKKVDRATKGNFLAWEQAFERWQTHLNAVRFNEEIALESQATDAQAQKSKDAKKTKVPDRQRKAPANVPKFLLDKNPNELLFEWGNLLGFLCSLAGVATNQENAMGKLVTQEKATMDDFFSTLMKLMVSDFVNIREQVKVMLGNFLSPAAYPILFRHLQAEAKKILFGDAGQALFNNASLIFVDQTISLIKLILENEHDNEDFSLVTDFEDLILSLLKFVRQLTFSVNSLQTKLRLCAMLESMMAKSKLLSFRNEHAFRMELVENLIEWTSNFSNKQEAGSSSSSSSSSGGGGSGSGGSGTGAGADGAADASKGRLKKIINELDLQVMKAISALLKNLPLQGEDDEAKSKAFSKFFSFFTRLLTRSKKEPQAVAPQLPEATVECLSALVTANIQHGLEYFVSMGYHEDHETRSAFLKVLTNILNQGTQFASDDESDDKYYKLIQLIFDPDLEIILTLGDATQITEADDVAQLLVRIFEANEKTIDLLKASITAEVERTDTANTLFRRNSMATKLLAAFCKILGRGYLQQALGNQMKVIMGTSASWELDPNKLPPGQSIEENQVLVTKVCQGTLKDVKDTMHLCPRSLREICQFLKQAVAKKFPGNEHTAVAGFMFLRFLCPAIVAPDGYGVVQSNISDKDTRRGLILITKVLQNLANRVNFTKEPFMNCMNSFIDNNLDLMKDLLDSFATFDPEQPIPPPLLFSDEEKDEDLGRLHFYLYGSQDKIVKALQAKSDMSSKPSDGPPLHDRLTTLLAQLGPPPEPNKQKAVARETFSSVGSKSNQTDIRFERFMSKMSGRDTDFIKSKDIFFQQGKHKNGAPVFYFICKNHKQDSVDHELLTFYMLKTGREHFDKPYCLVFDITAFGPENQPNLNFLPTLMKVLPQQAIDNLDSVFFLNPNQWFKKYSKRVAKHVSRIQKKFSFFTQISQLKEQVPECERYLPQFTSNLEKNIQATFSPVTKVTQYNKKEVKIQISTDNFHLISFKPVPVFGGNAHLHDIVHISKFLEFSLNPRDEKEFVIKYESGGQKTLALISPSANQIVQQLTASRDRYNLSKPQNSLSRRGFSPSDVPGTLLNMALLNLCASNHTLRIAAYNLLVSLGTNSNFSFNAKSILLEGSDIAVPRNSIHFITRISSELAERAPKFTLDFLLESLHGITKADKIGEMLVLEYINPWLDNVRLFAIPSADADNVEKIVKIKEVINSLVALSIRLANEYGPLNSVWTRLGKQHELIPVLFDCLSERAGIHTPSKQSPIGMKHMDCLEDIMIALATHNPQLVAGRIISSILNILQLATEQSERLDQLEVWPKIEVYLRWLLSLSFENLLFVEQFTPELLHIIVSTFGLGDSIVRATVYGLFMNVIHSLYTSRVCRPDKMQTLRFLFNDFHNLAWRLQFGINSNDLSPFSRIERDGKLEEVPITTVETVASSLMNVLNCCSETVSCIFTPFHSRWLSFSVAAAFSSNLAMQARGTISLGTLSQSPQLVSEDLVRNLLSNLRSSLKSMGKNKDELNVATVRALGKIYEHILPSSKFFNVFFWISMALIQVQDKKLFPACLSFLESVIKVMDSHECFVGQGMVHYCMNIRQGPFEPMLQKLDQITGLNFESNFSFAIVGHLLKGLKDASTKTQTARLLSTFIEVSRETRNSPNILGFLAALLPHKVDDTSFLRQTILANDSTLDSYSGPQLFFNPMLLPDRTYAALLFTFLATMLKSSDFEYEQLFIYKAFEEGVHFMPDAFPVTFDVLLPKISNVLLTSQNKQILEASLNILNALFTYGLDSSAATTKMTKQYLQGIGFSGLPESDQINPAKKKSVVQIVCNLIDAVLD